MKMVKLIFGGKLSAFYPVLRRDLEISMQGINGSSPSVGKILPVHKGKNGGNILDMQGIPLINFISHETSIPPIYHKLLTAKGGSGSSPTLLGKTSLSLDGRICFIIKSPSIRKSPGRWRI